ncbi:DUF2786 domain-containing protein [Leptospira santarosai]|uniref:DUF2786 domain-containing protein n=1 Tax=Leptospira santarosai TaxID=28183 RepID=UPI0026E3366E|nr:DUF2786 domain-containing protein [Leptospira santarosai]MDO6395478.1 DUF2786 domain-containing protein [Leptospira santarosai]
MGDRNSIIERVKKLIALSDSSNENEAKLAAQQATMLIQKFNIEASELDRGAVIEFDLKTGRSRASYWQSLLLRGIAESNFCSILIAKEEENSVVEVVYKIIGREVNVLATNLMYEYLCGVASLLSPKILSEKTPYLEGFAYGIAIRLSKRNELWGVAEESALIRVKSEDEVAIDKYLESKYPNIDSAPAKRMNMNESFRCGLDQSRGINLSKQIKPKHLELN